ncbi:MAG: SURF1 family protein [Burkholderiaceae bacterium]
MTTTKRIVAAAVVGAFGIWATCALGFWQLRRAAAKEILQQQIDVAATATPTAPGRDELEHPASLVHRHLRLQGRWLPDAVVYLDNRPQAGQAGFYVLMPLHIDEPVQADVLVNRGWTARNMNDRTRIAAYPTAAGTVEVTGVALAEEPRLMDLARPTGRALAGIWQNFDPGAYRTAGGPAVLPIVLRQDRREVGPGDDDGLSRDWPDRNGALQSQIDRHHGYAFQWFALATTLGALLLYQVFRVIRHGRTISP